MKKIKIRGGIMQKLILIIEGIINSIHDIILDLTSGAGLNLADKDLHL